MVTKAKKLQKAEIEKESKEAAKYWYGVGRRKTSVAQVRLFQDEKGKPDESSVVNGKKLMKYFPTTTLQNSALAPFRSLAVNDFNVSVLVRGGGVKSQAEAVCLGIARALALNNEDFKKGLRDNKLLTRDARIVERKKAGLKKARKSPQWAKR